MGDSRTNYITIGIIIDIITIIFPLAHEVHHQSVSGFLLRRPSHRSGKALVGTWNKKKIFTINVLGSSCWGSLRRLCTIFLSIIKTVWEGKVMVTRDDTNLLRGGIHLYSGNLELEFLHRSIPSTSCSRTDIQKRKMEKAPTLLLSFHSSTNYTTTVDVFNFPYATQAIVQEKHLRIP